MFDFTISKYCIYCNTGSFLAFQKKKKKTILCLVTQISSSKTSWRTTGLQIPVEVHMTEQILFMVANADSKVFHIQLQAPAPSLSHYPKEQLPGGITCQVLSRWFPQHLGRVSRTVGQPAGSSLWPLLCRRESFFDKPKHVHSCRQRYRPTGCFWKLKESYQTQEQPYSSQVSSVQCVTTDVGSTLWITRGVMQNLFTW